MKQMTNYLKINQIPDKQHLKLQLQQRQSSQRKKILFCDLMISMMIFQSPIIFLIHYVQNIFSATKQLMLQNVVKNFGSLTTMRVISRLLHFVLKTYLIRTQLNEEILAHLLNLDLIITISMHVVKSCFKPSYQKIENGENIIKSSMNIMTCGILVTILVAAAVSSMQYYYFLLSQKSLIYFSYSIVLYAFSAICQSVAQKYMVECVIKYQYLKMGIIEVISVIPKTVFIFVAAGMHLFDTYGIIIFAIGQIMYSFSLMIIFYIMSSNKSILLQSFVIGSKQVYFDPKSKQSLKQFSVVTILKLILQQFQRIVLVIMDISHVSSIYSLISNLGSVIVRYLFSPLNEIIYNYFSRGDQKESVQSLITFIKVILIFSVVSTSFGYNYSEIFLIFLYGQRWVTPESISAMRTYMTLIIFLGFNGIIEAFLFAKGKDSISRYNYFSVATTIVYLLATIYFLKIGLGATGLFLGNIVNMALRIIVCWFIQINRHVKISDLINSIKPSLFFIVTSIVVFFLSHKQYGFAQNIFSHNILKFGTGLFLFGVNLIPIGFENRQFLIEQVKNKLINRFRKLD